MTSILAKVPVVMTGELVETLVQSQTVRIERIVSQGHASPDGFWYDQPESECGPAAIRDDAVELKAGDWVDVASHFLCRSAPILEEREVLPIPMMHLVT
jgi:cupin 2 domain-containing protein